MRLSITHDTTYRYEDRVRASIQYLRLTPQDSERQHVVDWRLDCRTRRGRCAIRTATSCTS